MSYFENTPDYGYTADTRVGSIDADNVFVGEQFPQYVVSGDVVSFGKNDLLYKGFYARTDADGVRLKDIPAKTSSDPNTSYFMQWHPTNLNGTGIVVSKTSPIIMYEPGIWLLDIRLYGTLAVRNPCQMMPLRMGIAKDIQLPQTITSYNLFQDAVIALTITRARSRNSVTITTHSCLFSVPDDFLDGDPLCVFFEWQTYIKPGWDTIGCPNFTDTKFVRVGY